MTIPLGLCQCGCGKRTRVQLFPKGKLAKYVLGHHMRKPDPALTAKAMVAPNFPSCCGQPMRPGTDGLGQQGDICDRCLTFRRLDPARIERMPTKPCKACGGPVTAGNFCPLHRDARKRRKYLASLGA